MSIQRGHIARADHFAIIPNDWMRDPQLSYRAKGLLAHLMTHQVGWSISTAALMRCGTEGRDAIRSAIRELEGGGYLVREQLRDESGKLDSMSYTLTDPSGTPAPDKPHDTPDEPTDSPAPENPTPENPTTVNPHPKKTNSLEEQSSEQQPASAETAEPRHPDQNSPQLSLVEDPEGAPSRKSPERPIPNGWNPTPRHLAFCAEHNIAIDREVKKFKGHALANDRRLRNWNQGFTNWLNNGIAKGWVEKLPPPPKPEREEPDFVPTLKLRRPQP